MNHSGPAEPPLWLLVVCGFVLGATAFDIGCAVSWLLYGDADLARHVVPAGVAAVLATAGGFSADSLAALLWLVWRRR